ncbi:MAG: hypothetical protein KGJ78_15305 [Alphaproteobacteria bacterium]|nr:hypothetical protein [Alphaproteobacteria bacterium]
MVQPDPEFLPQGEDDAVHERSTPEARQAESTGRMRYVLAAGIILVLVAFALIWFGVA